MIGSFLWLQSMLSYEAQLTYLQKILLRWPTGMTEVRMSVYHLGSPSDIFDSCYILVKKEEWQHSAEQ